jgi:hypothetical protein
MNPQAHKKFDQTIAAELAKRLNRKPSKDELANADTDSDLVNEVLWQMINDLYNEIEKINKKP